MPDDLTTDDAPGADDTAAASRSMRRRVAPLVVLVVALVMGGLFWVLASSRSGDADEGGIVDSHLLGEPAPAVRTTTIDGQPFDLARRKGSWVVLNFFNSTCVPCKAEHPELVEFDQLQQSLGSNGAELYTVVQLDDDLNRVRDFFAERGGDWPVITDSDGQAFVSFGVAQVPETFIIDPDGVVRLRWAGPIDAATLSQLVERERVAYGG